MYLIYIGKRCSGVLVQDVVFVIDASGSIGHSHFQLIREFTTNITTTLINNSPRSAVGVIMFGDTAYIEFNLQVYTSLNTLLSAINQLPYNGGGTDTAEALTLLLLTAQNGKLGLKVILQKLQLLLLMDDLINHQQHYQQQLCFMNQIYLMFLLLEFTALMNLK